MSAGDVGRMSDGVGAALRADARIRPDLCAGTSLSLTPVANVNSGWRDCLVIYVVDIAFETGLPPETLTEADAVAFAQRRFGVECDEHAMLPLLPNMTFGWLCDVRRPLG